MTAADTWTDRYEGRAVCPDGHQFIATWFDTKRADQTCPACGRTFEADWPGFTFPVPLVIVRRGKAGRGAA